LTWLAARLLPVCLAVASGCDRGDASRGAVSGRVTLDGQPIAQGSILFTPLDGTQGAAVGGEIKDGLYRLAGAAGPAIGKNRVEVHAVRKTGKLIPKGLGGTGKMIEQQVEGVSARFNIDSKLQVEITPGENTADFEVTSK
jgi:hypothetical protein